MFVLEHSDFSDEHSQGWSDGGNEEGDSVNDQIFY